MHPNTRQKNISLVRKRALVEYMEFRYLLYHLNIILTETKLMY